VNERITGRFEVNENRREIGLPSAEVRINGLIAYHVRTRGFVLVYTCIKAAVRILYLCPRAFYAQSLCLAQSVVRSPHSAVRCPQCAFHTDHVNRHQSCLFRRYVISELKQPQR